LYKIGSGTISGWVGSTFSHSLPAGTQATPLIAHTTMHSFASATAALPLASDLVLSDAFSKPLEPTACADLCVKHSETMPKARTKTNSGTLWCFITIPLISITETSFS